jgi:bifunctional non-homologous end joining protein LigD
MATEDHPLEYLEFEGVIPRGQYGGGTVMVWDIGTYEIVDGNYYRGYLRVFLTGVKLKGEWDLRRLEQDKRDSWQLIKVVGSTRTVSKRRDDSSAVTGRGMAEIAAARDAIWQSNRT